MDNRIWVLTLVVVLGVLLIRIFAATYSMTVDQFRSLFSQMNDNRLIQVTTVGPNRELLTYQIYPIDIIQCYDKKDNLISLESGPALEITFSSENEKKKTVYFDTLRVSGNNITGNQSRYLNKKLSIDLTAVTKIEIRKLKRGFKYLKKVAV